MCDVDGDVVDVILEGALLEFGLLALHLCAICGGNLGGVELDGVARFEVYETVGACVVVELKLAGAVEGVEKDDFVLIVA